MKIVKLSLIMVLFFYPQLAAAESWVLVTQAGTFQHEVDTSSIRQLGPTTRKAWTRFSLKNKPKYGMTLEEFNCRSEESRTIYFSSEDENGGVTPPEPNPYSDWKPVVPGTVGQIILEYVCKHNR
jgi:hypothetical protein